jgi:hypothetical protein
MLKNFIISFLIVTNIITAAFCFGFHYRLEQSRQLIAHYRVELNAAQNRESDIAESIRRTGEILDSSITSVGELRNAIGEIRKNYEEMENRLHSIGDDCSFDDSHTNSREEKLK